MQQDGEHPAVVIADQIMPVKGSSARKECSPQTVKIPLTGSRADAVVYAINKAGLDHIPSPWTSRIAATIQNSVALPPERARRAAREADENAELATLNSSWRRRSSSARASWRR
jgi:hypothetical protein